MAICAPQICGALFWLAPPRLEQGDNIMVPVKPLMACVAVAVAIHGVGISRVRAQPAKDTDWKERFLTQAPRAWAELRTKNKRLQGAFTERRYMEDPPKKLVFASEYDLKQAPGCAMVGSIDVTQGEGKRAQRQVVAENLKYSFRLRQGQKSPDWTVVDIKTTGAKEAKPTSISAKNDADRAPNAGIRMNMYVKDDWVSLLKSAEFKLVSIVPITEGKETLACVEYELGGEATAADPFRVVKSGRVWFDPAHSWVMRKSEYRMQWGPKQDPRDSSATYDYEFGADGYPLLKEIVQKHFDSKGQLEAQQVYTFSFSFGDFPESDFRVSAFGLPEPQGVIWAQPTRWWLWLSLGGLAIAMLAGVIRLWRNRQGRLQPAP
jgi:hypothetical protein